MTHGPLKMILWIIVFVNFSRILRIFALLEMESFKKDVTFSNFLCPHATMDLGLHGKVTRCASTCSQTPSCRSFFYNKQGKQCKGAPGILTTTTGCTSLSGSLYFHTTDITTTTSTTTATTTIPSSQYGKPCTVFSDCTISNGMCVQNTCECQAGYSYNPSTDFCVSSCGKYGSTYIEYLNLDLAVIHSGEYHFVSLTKCLNYCSGTNTCRGVNYSPNFNGGMCRLKSQMNPNAFVYFSGVNFYARNCA